MEEITGTVGAGFLTYMMKPKAMSTTPSEVRTRKAFLIMSSRFSATGTVAGKYQDSDLASRDHSRLSHMNAIGRHALGQQDDVGGQANRLEAMHDGLRGPLVWIFRLIFDLHVTRQRLSQVVLRQLGLVHREAFLTPRRPHIDDNRLPFAFGGGQSVRERRVPTSLQLRLDA